MSCDVITVNKRLALDWLIVLVSVTTLKARAKTSGRMLFRKTSLSIENVEEITCTFQFSAK